MNEKQLRQLQLCELDIVTKCAELCDKYNLKYFLMYGTLLGAVRHEGFIAWGDDMDIGMPRQDYEKFIQIADKELPDEYKILHFSKKWNVPNKILRVENVKTTMIPLDKIGNPVEKLRHGVQIDVFPIDGFPADITNQSRLFKNVRFCMKIDTFFRQKCSKSYSFSHNVVIVICRMLGFFLGRCYWIEKYNSLLKKYNMNDTPYVSNAGWAFDPYRVYKADLFKDTVDIKFEGREFKCPKNWKELLTIEYGDFMALPPLEKRIPLHSNYIYDFEVGYNEWGKYDQ